MMWLTFIDGLPGVSLGSKEKQHAALRIGLAEDLAQLVGDQHRLDLGQLELLGDGVGGKALVEADDDRDDLAAAATGLDPLERPDRVQLHHGLVLLAHFLGRAPGLFHLLAPWSRPASRRESWWLPVPPARSARGSARSFLSRLAGGRFSVAPVCPSAAGFLLRFALVRCSLGLVRCRPSAGALSLGAGCKTDLD